MRANSGFARTDIDIEYIMLGCNIPFHILKNHIWQFKTKDHRQTKHTVVAQCCHSNANKKGKDGILEINFTGHRVTQPRFVPADKLYIKLLLGLIIFRPNYRIIKH